MVNPWVELYRPARVKDIVGNQKAARDLAYWLEQWPEVEKKTVLLVGPPGVGKTASVYAIAREQGREVIEMNASDQRNRDQIQNIAGMTTVHRVFTGKQKARILLLDEVDGVFGKEDFGGIGAISQVVRTSKIPVVMTANDLWDPKLASLRRICKTIKFKRLSPRSIKKVLQKIATDQDLAVSEQILDELARFSGGDLRAAINDLEAKITFKEEDQLLGMELTPRDQTKDIFNALTALFQARTVREALATTRGLDLDTDMFFQWIYENAHQHAGNSQELFNMYEELAHADVIRTRIRKTQNWKLLPYFIHHMTAGVTLNKKSGYHWVRHQFPTRLSDLSKSRKIRTLRNDIYSKVAKRAHLSTYCALLEYGFLLNFLFENNPETASKISIWLGLSDDEVKYLAGKEMKPIRAEIRKFRKEYNVQKQEQSRQRLKSTLLSTPLDKTQRKLEKPEISKEVLKKLDLTPKMDSVDSETDKPAYQTLDRFIKKGKRKRNRKSR
ncbi:MAG: replication factor C large subunit [Candidatus Heimdallarchaeota archaeon]